jgi:hypothetical protein
MKRSMRLVMVGLVVGLVMAMAGCDDATASDGGGGSVASEGTVAAPVELTVGTEKAATVGAQNTEDDSDYSYYTFTTSDAANYRISLSAFDPALGEITDGIRTYLYTGSDFTGAVFSGSATYYEGDPTSHREPPLSASTTYYLKVLNSEDSGVSFTLLISKL